MPDELLEQLGCCRVERQRVRRVNETGSSQIAVGRGLLVWVEDCHRPLGDSHYGNLHAGKRPFIRDGAYFALRLAGLGLSLPGRAVEQLPKTRVGVHKTCPHVLP